MSTKAPLVEKKEAPQLRRRAIIAFLLQTIPWAVYVAIFVIDEITSVSVGYLEPDTEQSFVYTYLISLAVIAILLTLGGIFSCKRTSSMLCVILMILYFLAFSAFSVSFEFVMAYNGEGIYALTIGLPMLITTLLHLLWAIFNKVNPLHTIFSAIILFLSAVVGIICLVIDYSISPANHPHIGLECAIFGVFNAIFVASWISAAKETIKLEYDHFQTIIAKCHTENSSCSSPRPLLYSPSSSFLALLSFLSSACCDMCA